jgi:hypothetical protein
VTNTPEMGRIDIGKWRGLGFYFLICNRNRFDHIYHIIFVQVEVRSLTKFAARAWASLIVFLGSLTMTMTMTISRRAAACSPMSMMDPASFRGHA